MQTYTPRHRERSRRLSQFGWIVCGYVATAMVALSLLAMHFGPIANRPVMALCAVWWLICVWFSARGFKGRGIG